MEKKKSHKKGNKTTIAHSRHEEEPKIPVSSIMREIGELKKQLVSIKSKKYLQIVEQEESRKKMQQREVGLAEDFSNTLKAQNMRIQESKQNSPVSKCPCPCSASKTKRNPSPPSSAPLKVQLFPLSAPKSRETKLKLSIQHSKLKSHLQTLYKSLSPSTYSPQPLNLLIAQLNSTLIYINSVFKDYEHQIQKQRALYREMKTQVGELSEKIVGLAERYSCERQTGEGRAEEVAELKRYLSYYLALMKDNKEQAEKYSKQYLDLQTYAKQLENNNELLRKEMKDYKDKYEEYEFKLKQNELQVQNVSKQLALLESDLHMTKVEAERNRDRRRQLEKVNQKLGQELREASYKLSNKEAKLVQALQQNLQLQKTLTQLKTQQKSLITAATTKKLQSENLQKQLTVLTLTLKQREQDLLQKDEQIKQLRYKLELQIKANRKIEENLEYCQMEIDSLSEEVDSLRKANQRYKNQSFRNRLVQAQSQGEGVQGESSRKGKEKSRGLNLENLQSKNRKKILGQIQELIERHKKSSDSESQQSQQQD